MPSRILESCARSRRPGPGSRSDARQPWRRRDPVRGRSAWRPRRRRDSVRGRSAWRPRRHRDRPHGRSARRPRRRRDPVRGRSTWRPQRRDDPHGGLGGAAIPPSPSGPGHPTRARPIPATPAVWPAAAAPRRRGGPCGLSPWRGRGGVPRAAASFFLAPAPRRDLPQGRGLLARRRGEGRLVVAAGRAYLWIRHVSSFFALRRSAASALGRVAERPARRLLGGSTCVVGSPVAQAVPPH